MIWWYQLVLLVILIMLLPHLDAWHAAYHPKSVQLLAEAEVTTLQSNVKGEVWISWNPWQSKSGFAGVLKAVELWVMMFESVLSLIVYYSCNYQKSCAVSWLFVFVLKEPTLHPWNFTWFNTSSEKMHHRWSVYSSSSAFSCKEADRLRASHNRLPCDPSLAHARNDDFSRKLCSIFFGQRREFQATQWISMQYNNTQFESFRSLCLRQQCLFSNSPLATCRFTPTPPLAIFRCRSRWLQDFKLRGRVRILNRTLTKCSGLFCPKRGEATKRINRWISRTLHEM